MRQVALAPRLEYSRRLLEKTTADLAAYLQEQRDISSDRESECTILFCLEAVRRANNRLCVRHLRDIPRLVPPVVWVLRATSARISGHLPGCSAQLSELAVHLGSIAVDASILAGMDIRHAGPESDHILESARSAAEAGVQRLHPSIASGRKRH